MNVYTPNQKLPIQAIWQTQVCGKWTQAINRIDKQSKSI